MDEFNDLVDRYIAVWNETDAAKRQALIAGTFTADTHFVDPIQEGSGRDGIEALVVGVQQKFPGLRFTRTGAADGFGDRIRFRWALGPEGGEALVEGTDFATLAGGRLAAVTGFFDRLPTA